MSAVYFLVPISVCLAMFAVAAFIFAVRKGQFGDVESQKWKILFDQEGDSSKMPSEPIQDLSKSTTTKQ
jgi:cbb3-type cytochrome oxidase maturation protein